MGNTCDKCRFFNTGALECRRHAPIIKPLGEYRSAIYPCTFPMDWCGDWEWDRQRAIALHNDLHRDE